MSRVWPSVGQCEESGADGASDDQAVGVVAAEVDGPADHVVCEDCALEPRRVRPEHSGGELLEAGAGVQIFDRQLDGGVFAAEPVDVDDVTAQVGEERVVTPVGPPP